MSGLPVNRSLWFYLFAFAAAGQTAPARGPLRILSSNPRYFSDGAGKAIYLTGTHNWNNFPGGRAVFSTPFPGPAVLYLKRTGGGSVRCPL